MPGINLDQVLDALADKVAARLRESPTSNPSAGIKPRLLTVDQAAMYIGRSKDAVQHMIASGKMPTVRADRRVFLDVCDLDDWIEQNKASAIV